MSWALSVRRSWGPVWRRWLGFDALVWRLHIQAAAGLNNISVGVVVRWPDGSQPAYLGLGLGFVTISLEVLP